MLTWELWKEDTQEWVPFDQPVNVGEVGETKDKIAEVISKNARTRNLHGKQAKVSETLAPDTDRAPMRDRTLSDEHMAIANSPDEARALAQLEAYRVAMMFQKVFDSLFGHLPRLSDGPFSAVSTPTAVKKACSWSRHSRERLERAAKSPKINNKTPEDSKIIPNASENMTNESLKNPK